MYVEGERAGQRCQREGLRYRIEGTVTLEVVLCWYHRKRLVSRKHRTSTVTRVTEK